jgi:hypothetical protein
VDEGLNDEQRRRPVVELFALVHADVDAHLAATLTEALGLGQLVVPGLAGQDLRQAAATVGSAPPLGPCRRRRFSQRCRRVLARGLLREQQGLVGVEALAACRPSTPAGTSGPARRCNGVPRGDASAGGRDPLHPVGQTAPLGSVSSRSLSTERCPSISPISARARLEIVRNRHITRPRSSGWGEPSAVPGDGKDRYAATVSASSVSRAPISA